MTFRRAFHAVFSSAALLGLVWGCSAAGDSGGDAPAGGGSSGIVEAGNDHSFMPGSGDQDSGPLRLNPLCGKPDADNSCVPDSPLSCAVFSPPLAPSEDASSGTEAAAGGQAGASANGEGGSGGDGQPGATASAAGEGGASGAAGEGGAGGTAGVAGEGGAAGASSPSTPPQYSCQVQRAASAPYEAFSRCAPAGPGAENAPCLTSNDCQAGLGCVGDQTKGLCLKYCCQDADDCEPGTYCAERPMRDSITNTLPQGVSDSLSIPVCVRAENCDLNAPYPCPRGKECACKSGTACLVVRSDGTTTCAVPGAGKVGEACPCAWGHVCSAATNQCLQLCNTRDDGACGAGKCQSASELPDGWGVCVGSG